jgi:hypothetical protein
MRACIAMPSIVVDGIWRTYDSGSATSICELSHTTVLLTSRLPSFTTGAQLIDTQINSKNGKAILKYILATFKIFVSLAS